MEVHAAPSTPPLTGPRRANTKHSTRPGMSRTAGSATRAAPGRQELIPAKTDHSNGLAHTSRNPRGYWARTAPEGPAAHSDNGRQERLVPLRGRERRPTDGRGARHRTENHRHTE